MDMDKAMARTEGWNLLEIQGRLCHSSQAATGAMEGMVEVATCRLHLRAVAEWNQQTVVHLQHMVTEATEATAPMLHPHHHLLPCSAPEGG